MSVPAEEIGADSAEEVRTPEEINLDQLGATLRSRFGEAETERQIIEQEWLKSLRQYKGIYDPEIEVNFKTGKSRAFIRLTRTKVKSTDARIMDMLFPAGTEKNWEINPTPDPEVSADLHKDIIIGMAKAKFDEFVAAADSMDDGQKLEAAVAGSMPSRELLLAVRAALEAEDLESLPPDFVPGDEDVMKAVAADADVRCEKMSTRIDDQLTEARYTIVARDVIHSGNLYGTGILKGPLVERRLRKKWVYDDKAKSWVARDAEEEFRPFAEFTPIWDVYPDQSVSEIGQCEYVFQRHVMNRAAVRKLKKRPDFKVDVIERYIREHPEGDAQYKTWEVDLRTISKDENYKTHDRRRHYEILEFWGVLDGADLSDCGCDIPDELKSVDVEVNAWLIGNRIIKIELNPAETGYRPYHFFYFEKDDTSIWGIGIPEVYRWAQMIFNAAMRAALDNLGITAGPIYEVNLDLLDPDDRAEEMFPFRVVLRRGKGIDAQHPAVRVHEASSRVGELLKVADLAKQLGDETTTVPSYTHGEQDKGVSRTVGGLSMLMGAATVTTKDIVRNYDDGITKPFITAMFEWNMQFSDDQSIKGDFQVSAQGSSSLVAKELYGDQLDRLSETTANPADGPYVRRRELVAARFQARDLDPKRFVKDGPEVEDELRGVIQELTARIAAMEKSMPPAESVAA